VRVPAGVKNGQPPAAQGQGQPPARHLAAVVISKPLFNLAAATNQDAEEGAFLNVTKDNMALRWGTDSLRACAPHACPAEP